MNMTHEQKMQRLENVTLPQQLRNMVEMAEYFGADRLQDAIAKRVDLLHNLISKAGESMPVEDIVIYLNDLTPDAATAQDASPWDMAFNQHINIVAGLRIRGFNI